jgi:IS1 family transposase
MNKLPNEKRVAVVKMLMEGMSIRGATRVTGVSKNTIQKLGLDLGAACWALHERKVRSLASKRIEADEIWSFVGMKQKNVPEEKHGEFGYGDVWVWKAIDAESKLIVSWLVGPRDGEAAREFIGDLGSRLANRIQLTTDGHKPYLEAVEAEFGADIDFAQLVKTYGNAADGAAPASVRYSPVRCTGIQKNTITGTPEEGFISTSYAERESLTRRMSMRRFTRLTNAFSKKVENHAAATALYITHYNFCRVHQTLRVTPAMEAGITDHPWEVEELVALLDAAPVINLVNAANSN